MVARVLILGSLLVGTVSADDAPKPGTFYKHGQLGIKKTEVTGTRIKLTFTPMKEQFFWCPGVKIQNTEKATVVTFVRCKTSKSCGIDAKAAIGKKLIRTITIDSRGKDTYIRNGAKQFKKIYTAPKKKTGKKGTKKSPRPSSNQSADVDAVDTELRVWIVNQYAKPVGR